MRKFILNSTLLIVSTIFCLIILDFGVRFIMPHYDPSGHINFMLNRDGVPISMRKGSFRQIKNTGLSDTQISWVYKKQKHGRPFRKNMADN